MEEEEDWEAEPDCSSEFEASRSCNGGGGCGGGGGGGGVRR